MGYCKTFTTNLSVIFLCFLTSVCQPAKAQDWKAIWEQEHARCFANGFDSTAYANSNIVPVLEKAAEEGDADAEMHLLYWKLYGGAEDDGEIFERLYRLAEKNVAFASFSLGMSYLHGDLRIYLASDDSVYSPEYLFSDADKPKGIPYLQKAAEGGVPSASALLTRMYLGFDVDFDYNGVVEPDFDKAFYYAKLGADQGDAYSQHGLAVMFYHSNKDYPQTYVDEEKFKYWLRKSAENGYYLAQFWAGVFIAETNEARLYWFKKAASQGFENAIESVAKQYLSMKEYDKVVKWCNEYLDQYPHLVNLGFSKYDALDKMGSKEEAIKCLDELSDFILANPGIVSVKDIYHVAMNYDSAAKEELNGRRQYNLHAKAIPLFTLAAEEGNAESMLMLSYHYLLGWGTRINQSKAKIYCVAAAGKGDASAQEMCNRHNWY